MDKRMWSIITKGIVAVNRSLRRRGRKPTFGDVLILRMYFWTVWHDRPLSWAHDRAHYGGLFRPRQLPSRSQFARRMKTPRVNDMLAEVNRRLAQQLGGGSLMFLDGKPLAVSESTGDPEAKTGRGNGRFSRGYKIHALGSERGAIAAFSVRPLNEHEVPVARRDLLGHVPAGVLLLADGNYDSSELYQEVHQRGAWLLTPLKGKRAQSKPVLAKMSDARREVHAMWGRREQSCWDIYRQRGAIERIFSALTCFGGGLGPLPSWVRRLDRVTRWVTAKLAIYHAKLCLRRAIA
jgi:hypothetical protein